MAYRYTNTDKWKDSWFSELPQLQMLLFLYLCDNCDIAGFIEINIKRWASDLGSSKETIQGAIEGLSRGLLFSKNNDCIFIKNFLKHQKNIPLNEKNNAHLGIIKRFELYMYKFDFKTIEDFILAPSQPLVRGYGNGNGNGIEKETWKNDFEIYKKELKEACSKIITKEYIEERQKFHPNLDIRKTLEKSYTDYWVKEVGWKNKKAKKTIDIDWKSTFNNALTQKMNQVYKQKDEKREANY